MEDTGCGSERKGEGSNRYITGLRAGTTRLMIS